MKTILFILCITNVYFLHAQTEPGAGKWKTWFIASGSEYRLPSPPDDAATKEEIKKIIALQKEMDSATLQKILYWNAGAPGYRWREVLSIFFDSDTTAIWRMAGMLLNVTIYDGIIAAWDSKYTYNRARPFIQDADIKAYVLNPESPSYPCEQSVTAGVAATILAHFYPDKKDTINQLADEVLQSRIAAGVSFPSDTKAGFDLGKKIAEKAIEKTKNFMPAAKWDGTIPDKPGLWKGKKPFDPLWGTWKTMVLKSGDQLRPAPPPDYKKEMEELKNFKPTFKSTANAFYNASHDFWNECFDKKIFEYNVYLNPPRAARIYAIKSIAGYDAGIACWDAKYAYWGTRPDQYDTTYHPVLMGTPPFPGYPSGHATRDGYCATLMSYFFPAEKDYFWKKAKEGAESRFEGGVHFRTDNEVGLEMGRKVAELVLQKAKEDGADKDAKLVRSK